MKASILFALLIISGTAVFAQHKSKEYMPLQYSDRLAGGTLGFTDNSAGIMLGANFEYQLPQAGVGMFSVGFLGRYWRAADQTPKGDIHSSIFAVGTQINYNFNQITNGRFIPFVGIVLGYRNVTTKYTAFGNNSLIGYDQHYSTGFMMWGQGGFRYFMSRKTAATVRFAFGSQNFSNIEAGLDFKF